MKQQNFEKLNQGAWSEFQSSIEFLEDHKGFTFSKKKREEEANFEYEDFIQCYRKLCHDLALAKERAYSSHLVNRLNALVLRGHQQLYQSSRISFSNIAEFVFWEFPMLIRQEIRFVWFATALLYLPALVLGFLIFQSPELIYSILDAEQVNQFESMYDPSAEHIGSERKADSDFQMFGFYIYNNIGVGFRTFAGGFFYGIGSIFFLVFNGIQMGGVAGHLINMKYSQTFFSFVIGHSSFELTAIVLSGAAGLKLGFSMIAPGRLSRLQALKEAAKVSIKIVYGVIGMLVLAAFVEGFWSSSASIDPSIKYVVGSFLWLIVILYFFLVGRAREFRSY